MDLKELGWECMDWSNKTRDAECKYAPAHYPTIPNLLFFLPPKHAHNYPPQHSLLKFPLFTDQVSHPHENKQPHTQEVALSQRYL